MLKAIEDCTVCASAEALEELESVLRRPKLNHYLDEEMRRSFLGFLHGEAVMVAGAGTRLTALAHSCRDPKDVKFLALALAAEADVLVSSDKDLLVLHPWRGIGIVTPAEFVGDG